MSDFTSPFNASLPTATPVDRDLKSNLTPSSGTKSDSDVRSFARDYSAANDRQRASNTRPETTSQDSPSRLTGQETEAEPKKASRPVDDARSDRKNLDDTGEVTATEPGERLVANGLSAETAAGTELTRLNTEKSSLLGSSRSVRLDESNGPAITDSLNPEASLQVGRTPVPDVLADQSESIVGSGDSFTDTEVGNNSRILLQQTAQADLANSPISNEGRSVTAGASNLVGLETASLSTNQNNTGVLNVVAATSTSTLAPVVSPTAAGAMSNADQETIDADAALLLAGTAKDISTAPPSLAGPKVGEMITPTAMASHFKQLSANNTGVSATTQDSKVAAPTDANGVIEEVIDTAHASKARQVITLTAPPTTVSQIAANTNAIGVANSASASNLVMRDSKTSRSFDLPSVSSAAAVGESEMSASQLQAGQMMALATRNSATSTTSPPVPVAGEVQTSLNSELSTVGGNTAKHSVLADGSNPLGAAASTLVATSLADNMLAAGSSGTVTAPVLARTDSVNAQMVSAPLNVPLMLPTANEAMTSNISWMVKEGVQNASVNVSPAGMGPISVKIGIENEQMNVSIVATQGTTREALEAMLPRLREQLSAQGHDNVRVDVSDSKSDQPRGNNAQNQQQNQSFERQNFGGEQSSGNNAERSSEQADQHSKSGNDQLSTANGERELTDAERARLDTLSESFPQNKSAIASVQHGYDLYV